MFEHVLGSTQRRLLTAFAVLLASLLAFAPMAPAFATGGGDDETECPPDILSPAEIHAILQELAALARAAAEDPDGDHQDDLEALLPNLYALVDHLLYVANHLPDEHVDAVLGHIEDFLLTQDLDDEQIDRAMGAVQAILGDDEPVTAEQVLGAIFAAISPILVEHGYTEEEIAFLYDYLLSFSTPTTCPEPSPSPSPSPSDSASPSPSPSDSASPSPSATPSDGPTSSPSPSPSTTASVAPTASPSPSVSPSPRPSLPATGLGMPTLLVLVAVALVTGGTALTLARSRERGGGSGRERGW